MDKDRKQNHEHHGHDQKSTQDHGREEKRAVRRREEDKAFDAVKSELASKQNELRAMDDDNKKLLKEIETLKDTMLRRQADYENYKKRNMKLQEEYRKFVIRDFALEIIKINDDLLRAVDAASVIKPDETLEASHKSFVEGVRMISSRIEESLGKFGVVEIESMNREFDPNMHEAVEIENSRDVNSDTVTKVHEKGFRIDELVVRTAKVRVARPDKGSAEKSGADTPQEGKEASNSCAAE